jgi:hypothetical protein
MSKRLVFSILCLAACFSIGTWAAYRFVFSPGPEPEVVEVAESTEEISTDPGDDRVRPPCSEDIVHVSFHGVSFDFDRCALGDVNAEDIAEYRLPEPTAKPDGVAPAHVNFTFESGPKYWGPTLDIYPLAEFPRMYSVDRESERAVRDQIKNLKRVLIDKNFRQNDQIPYLPFVDASQEFQTNVKLVKFENGRGIFFVTYISTEMILVGNDHLRYIFEGITDDGRYILAEMPIRAPFLKDESSEEFEGYSLQLMMEDYKTNNIAPRYTNYISSITKRLEAMRPEEFQPDLRKLEDVVASLKITK